jgi:hypothetical protein
VTLPTSRGVVTAFAPLLGVAGLADEGIACAMTEGGSGGPWLSEFDPRTGLGVISGVTTFRYSGQDRLLYSAGLGPVAQALYERAASSLSGQG